VATWKAPENGLTKNEKVTLRRQMSHTVGLTVHGFPGDDELKKPPSAGYKIEEATLNRLGYTLLFSGQTQDAIAVFERNVAGISEVSQRS